MNHHKYLASTCSTLWQLPFLELQLLRDLTLTQASFLIDSALYNHLCCGGGHPMQALQGARGSLSQDLVALWVDEYGPALSLLRRIFPPGLMRYLNVKKQAQIAPLLINPSQSQQVFFRLLSSSKQWPCWMYAYRQLLCCAVQCCAVLCCAVLCCAVLCCAVLCCAVLCCAVLCSAVLCCAVLCCAVLCCDVLCCAVLCCAGLCCAVLACAGLCCAAASVAQT